MKPVQKKIEIRAGNSFQLAFRLYSVDPQTKVKTYTNLTGWTGRAVVRLNEDSPVIGTMTVVIDPDQTANRGLVRVTMTPAETATLLAYEGGVWGCKLTSADGTESHTWMVGPADITKDVAS